MRRVTLSSGLLASIKDLDWSAVIADYKVAKAAGTERLFPPMRIANTIAFLCGVEQKTGKEVCKLFGELYRPWWASQFMVLHKLVPEVQAMFDPSCAPEQRLSLTGDARELSKVPRESQVRRAQNLLSARHKAKGSRCWSS